MDEEKQRIKIAEACGWKEIRAEVDWLPKELTGIFTWPHPTDAEKIKYFINRKPIPDYLNDLNAMRKAESTMGDPQLWMEYEDNLAKVMNHVGWIWHASASERAEAFLRTLNLWEK